MARPKVQAIDVAQNLFWYDATAIYLRLNFDVKTDEEFSFFFHENLNIESDSQYFSKIKNGKVTLGNKWVERIREKLPNSIELYDHYIWSILKNIPKFKYETWYWIKKAPEYLKKYMASNYGEGALLNAEILNEIKNFHNLDSFGFLFLLYILAEQQHDLPMLNLIYDLILDSMEKISLLVGMERAHIFLFNIIQTKLIRIESSSFNDYSFQTPEWLLMRSDWELENSLKSTLSEQRILHNKNLRIVYKNSRAMSEKVQEIMVSGFNDLRVLR